MKNLDLSIIIVSYNTRNVTLNCLKTIFESKTKFSFEVIVIDNNSNDGSVEAIKLEYPTVEILAQDNNLGFSRANNIGIKRSQGSYILLLNSDTILFHDSLDNLLNSTIENKYKICAPILLNEDLSLQRNWFDYPSLLKLFLRFTDLYKPFFWIRKKINFDKFIVGKRPAFLISEMHADCKVDYLSFACILFDKDILLNKGLLDENLMFYHEDCEYGLRLKNSESNFMYNTSAKVIHLGGTSSSNSSLFAFENDIKGVLYIFKKYYSVTQFKLLKLTLLAILSIRIVLWNLGFYRRIGKLGLYISSSNVKNSEKIVYQKYKEIFSLIQSYN